MIFWKNLIDDFFVRNHDTPLKHVLQNIFAFRNSYTPQNDSPNSIVAFVDQSKSTLLQTARADAFNIETKSSVKTRILFNTGS